MDSKRSKITAIRLINSLELATQSEQQHLTDSTNHLQERAYLNHLKLVTTVKHVQSLLDSVDEPATASTSRSTMIQRNSLLDLQNRLQAVSAALLSTPVNKPTYTIPVQPLSIPSPPSLPPPPAFPTPPPPEFSEPLSSLLPTSSPPPASTPLPDLLLPVPSSSLRQRGPSSLLPSTSSLLPSPSPSFPDAPSTTSSHLLDHHASLQSSLLTQLTSMSSQLRLNSLSLSSSLAADRDVVESAQGKLEGNLGRMRKEGGRLGGYGRGQRGTTCLVVGLVAVVGAAWVVMFLLIKVT